MLKKLFYKKEKGITLVEVIVAAFILVVAIVGSYQAFTRIVIATSSASDRLVAAYLAQEGIEIIRNIRDTNWINGSAWSNILTTCPGGCQVDYKTGTPDGPAYPITFLPGYGNGDYLTIDGDGFYAYEAVGTTVTKFKRKITITPSGDDKLDVVADIMWADRGQSYGFQAEESLYNWR